MKHEKSWIVHALCMDSCEELHESAMKLFTEKFTFSHQFTIISKLLQNALKNFTEC